MVVEMLARRGFAELIRTIILVDILHLDAPRFLIRAVKIKKFNFHIFTVRCFHSVSIRLS